MHNILSIIKLDILCLGYFLSTIIYFSTILLAENPQNGREEGNLSIVEDEKFLVFPILSEEIGKRTDILCSGKPPACLVAYWIVTDLHLLLATMFSNQPLDSLKKETFAHCDWKDIYFQGGLSLGTGVARARRSWLTSRLHYMFCLCICNELKPKS